MLKKSLNSPKYAWNGLRTAWREQHNFRMAVLCAIVVLFCIFYFNFTYVESALCVFAIVMVLGSEVANTAVEDLCNRVEPNHDSTIGKIKDTMAGFVLITAFGAFVVGILVFYHHFFIV